MTVYINGKPFPRYPGEPRIDDTVLLNIVVDEGRKPEPVVHHITRVVKIPETGTIDCQAIPIGAPVPEELTNIGNTEAPKVESTDAPKAKKTNARKRRQGKGA